MSLDDLVQLLTKEAVIYTYRPEALLRSPADVEHRYRKHASTHVPLGDTERYVDTIIRWVGGGNKGAFVGAVIGDYGQGKTSFLIHVWASCRQRQVLAVPPFTLDPEGIRTTSTIIERIMRAVDGWVQYCLKDSHPTHAARAAQVYQQFRARTMEEAASRIARERGLPYEQVLALLDSGEVHARTEVFVKDLYDYLEALSQVVEDTGAYRGLLVLLDEPEVAARNLTTNEVAGFLFDITDTAGQRDGNYGFFLAIAANFYAAAEASFSSLTARLQRCGCRVVLDNLYGPDFARALWERYCERLAITEHSDRIVLPLTLEAIGQLGSSARRDLGEGPRTVVSAFARMVARFREQGLAYHPADFAADCLSGEVYVKAEYATRVNHVFSMPEVRAADERLRLTLAAFPDGVPLGRLEEAEFAQDDVVTFQNRAHAWVYRIGDLVGFEILRSGNHTPRDLLREAITTFVGEYAPRPDTFRRARQALAEKVVPQLFTAQQGYQLVGWDGEGEWRTTSEGNTIYRQLQGAFPLTADQFPQRTVIVAVGDAAADSNRLVAGLPRPDDRLIDAVVHVRLNWAGPPTPDEQRLTVDVGDPKQRKPALLALTVDINHDPLSEETLEQYVPASQQKPMLLLYLLERMDRQSFPLQEDAAWEALRVRLLRALVLHVFGAPEVAALAETRLGSPVRAGMDTLPEILLAIFRQRYPKYVTVINTPRWRDKLQDYMKLISDVRIPLAVRRGLEPWLVTDDVASRVLGVNKMNLASAFAEFDQLIEVASKGRGKGVEIKFHLHSLEEEFRNRIQSSNLMYEFNGRLCPYVRIDDQFVQNILAEGYLVDEAQIIVDIGRQRKTFSVGQIENTLVIYCEQFDIEVMKRSLRDKLDHLSLLYQQLAEVGWTSTDDVVRKIGKEIKELRDELEYDRLIRRIDEEEDRVKRNISEVCRGFEQRITAAANKAREIRQALDGAGTAGLSREFSGRTTWVGNLDRVRHYLLNRLHDVRNKANRILESVEPIRAVARDLPDAPVQQRIDRLKDAQVKIRELEMEVADAEVAIREPRRHIGNFNSWRELLVVSDAVHDTISRLENESVHREWAAALRAKYDAISRQIDDLLRTRHDQALETGEQWKQQIADLEQEIKGYQRGLREQFNATKTRASQLLREVGLGDVLLRQGFDEAEVEASYQRLLQEAEARLREAIQREEEGLQKRKIEVLYERDVLRRLDRDKGVALEAQIGEALKKLAEASTSATAAEIERTVNSHTQWPQGGLAEVGGPWVTLRDALTAAREAQRAVRLPPSPSDPAESEEARKLDALLADGAVRDLKDLILSMLREGSNPSAVLDLSLKALEELFRLGHVEIKVQRALRR